MAEPAAGRLLRVRRAARTSSPLDEPAAGNAIHGLVRWARWTVAEREADRVVLEHTLHPQPGYPFALELSIEYALSPAGLRSADDRDECRRRTRAPSEAARIPT